MALSLSLPTITSVNGICLVVLNHLSFLQLSSTFIVSCLLFSAVSIFIFAEKSIPERGNSSSVLQYGVFIYTLSPNTPDLSLPASLTGTTSFTA
jgi:hypothetical protein